MTALVAQLLRSDLWYVSVDRASGRLLSDLAVER